MALVITRFHLPDKPGLIANMKEPVDQSVFFRHIPVIPFLHNVLAQVDAFLWACAINIHVVDNKDAADP